MWDEARALHTACGHCPELSVWTRAAHQSLRPHSGVCSFLLSLETPVLSPRARNVIREATSSCLQWGELSILGRQTATYVFLTAPCHLHLPELSLADDQTS